MTWITFYIDSEYIVKLYEKSARIRIPCWNLGIKSGYFYLPVGCLKDSDSTSTKLCISERMKITLHTIKYEGLGTVKSDLEVSPEDVKSLFYKDGHAGEIDTKIFWKAPDIEPEEPVILEELMDERFI